MGLLPRSSGITAIRCGTEAADDYYFLKETRVPRVAWRFVYTDAMNYPEDGDEDLSEMEQYI